MLGYDSPRPPKVTVLLPVFNADAFLRESVQSILDQTFSDFELLAINDGSTDNSPEILTSFSDPRVVILDNRRNQGLIHTLNHGISIARGQYIARMDADDISNPSRLEKQVAFLDANSRVALLGSWADLIDHSGKRIQLLQTPIGNREIHEALLRRNCFIHPSVMLRSDVVRRVGAYRQEAVHAEDYELWLRVSEDHEVENLPEPLVRYRIHPNQVSQRQLRTQRERADAVRLDAWRRRLRSGDLAPETESPIPGLFAKLRGESGTVGGDYRGWLRIYRAMGNEHIASQLLFPLLLAAPLNRHVYRELWRESLHYVFTDEQLRAIGWYKKQIASMFSLKR